MRRGAIVTGRLRRGLVSVRDLLLGYALKFGVVGGVGYLLDVGIFNSLRLDLGDGPITESSFTAKAISVSVATVATWFGNRFWTFRDRRRHDVALEFIEFVAIAAVGMSISLGSLYVSRHVLGATSLLADNIAANVVGLALATAFRFLMYRYWVYGDGRRGSRAATTVYSG
jgi:putative flippase GtrA